MMVLRILADLGSNGRGEASYMQPAEHGTKTGYALRIAGSALTGWMQRSDAMHGQPTIWLEKWNSFWSDVL